MVFLIINEGSQVKKVENSMNCRVIVTAMIEKDGKILLGRKPKDQGPYPNTWYLPGGGLNLGEESIAEAIQREVREETGIEIKSIQQAGFDEDYENNKHGELTHYIFLIFTAKYKSGDVKANDDIVELQWIEKHKIKNLPLPRPSQKYFRAIDLLA